MNKGEIRRQILEQVDWSPDQSASFKTKVDRLINRAYQQLSLEAPFLFFEDQIRIITQPDAIEGANTSDRLNVNTSDKYVLERSYTGSLPSDYTTWATDGTWDGRMIEVTQADGTILRRRIREVWTDSGSPNKDRITVDHPWPNNSDTAMTYRIFTPEYELPADTVELRSARLWSDARYELEIKNQYDMERYDYIDYQGQQEGRPYSLFRGPHHQIDAPTSKPEPELVKNQTVSIWDGPDLLGKFDYCYTYVWGKRDSELESPRGFYEPKWESAPSPISEAVTVPDVNHNVTLHLPNIDHSLTYYKEWDTAAAAVATPVRYNRTGLKKRIYVRRYSATNIPTLTTSRIEANPEIFYLLAEVDGSDVFYYHRGREVPDYHRRLKETHGYQTIRLNPMPDQRYEVDCRVLRRPQTLVNDQDAPRIHEEAIQVLIELALVYFYELQGSLDLSQNAERRFAGLLKTLTKRYGVIPRHRPSKKFARVRRPFREVRVRFTE